MKKVAEWDMFKESIVEWSWDGYDSYKVVPPLVIKHGKWKSHINGGLSLSTNI